MPPTVPVPLTYQDALLYENTNLFHDLLARRARLERKLLVAQTAPIIIIEIGYDPIEKESFVTRQTLMVLQFQPPYLGRKRARL